MFSLRLTLILTLIGFATSVAHGAAPAPFTVCTITANSSNEKNVFRKSLPKGQFEFVELTEAKGESVSWFDNACAQMKQQHRQCDILLVSGHFAGTAFFGHDENGETSDKSWSVDEIESHSCSNDCEEIIRAPKEIFLFGCNTLAGKQKDRRTPQQYQEILVREGIPREQATQMAQFRYGPLGESASDRMERIFWGVPHIYGFDSVAPSGKHIQAALARYLKGVGNYGDHLNQVSRLTTNRKLELSLGLYNFDQTQGVSVSQPGYQVHEGTCGLKKKKGQNLEVLKDLEKLLREPNRVLFVDQVRGFFDEHTLREMSNEELASTRQYQG